MIVELTGKFYCDDDRRDTHAMLNLSSVEFIIARMRQGSKAPYIFIHCSGHYLNWVFDDDDELRRKYRWLKSKLYEYDFTKRSPSQVKPIESINNNIDTELL